MKVQFPKDWKTDAWHGYARHKFQIDGHDAWFVEPKDPVGDGRWSWCMCWGEAFVERTGAPDLLQRGFYHGYVEAQATHATPEGQKILLKFYAKAQELGLAPRVNLIGMSWGGFFSLRFASENPEKIACIYLDAPLCNMADRSNPDAVKRCEDFKREYGLSDADLESSRFNPVTSAALAPIVKAGIPLFAATGESDLVVPVSCNINLLEKTLKELGVSLVVRRRGLWGHHPHGFDDRSELISFMVSNAAERARLN